MSDIDPCGRDPLEALLICGRWYAACTLSLRHIEEMAAERGVFVDHATVRLTLPAR
jgi:transposase-like protein